MKGIVEGIVKKGKYKGKKIEIEIGEHGVESHVKVNGKTIDEHVMEVHIHIKADDMTKFDMKMVGLEKEG